MLLYFFSYKILNLYICIYLFLTFILKADFPLYKGLL